MTDLIISNASIVTQSQKPTRPTALAIQHDRIVAVGADEEILNLAQPHTQHINAKGRLILPGLTDAHVHLSWYADFLQNVDLTKTTSPHEAAQRVADRVSKTPTGQWIEGHGWSQDDWPDRRFPSATDLDPFSPNHPIYLIAHSAHAAWVNSRALQIAHITANTPDPPGGHIQRDESGQPTGILLETAMELVKNHLPALTPDALAERVKIAIDRANRAGLTGLHDFDGPLAFQAYHLLHTQRELNLRIHKNIPVAYLDHAIALGIRSGFGDDWLRLGAVKTFADGALGPRTAWMIDPYETEPDNRGIAVTDPEEMMENVRRASRAGLPSTIHAIGDRAVHHVLNVFEAVRKEEAEAGITPDQRRHRIEHVQLIAPDDVPRLGQLGIIASMQPNHIVNDMIMADTYWGDRAEYSYNWRMQLDAGAVLALGSDAPIEPLEPLPNLQVAMTRRRPDGSPDPLGWRSGKDARGRLTFEEALHGFTIGPAYAAGVEDRLGRILAGYLADLIVLDRDITTIDPMTIGDAKVVGTMIGGRWVYRDF